MRVEISETTESSSDEGVVVEAVVEGLPDPLVVEEVYRNGVFRWEGTIGDVEVEPDVDRLHGEARAEDCDALGPFEVTDE